MRGRREEPSQPSPGMSPAALLQHPVCHKFNLRTHAPTTVGGGAQARSLCRRSRPSAIVTNPSLAQGRPEPDATEPNRVTLSEKVLQKHKPQAFRFCHPRGVSTAVPAVGQRQNLAAEAIHTIRQSIHKFNRAYIFDSPRQRQSNLSPRPVPARSQPSTTRSANDDS